MVEQGPYKAEVVGSSPTVPIWAISSMAERSLDVRKVIGSSPISPTCKKFKRHWCL